MSRQNYTATSLEEWTRSDNYFNSFLLPEDPTLDGIAENNRQRGLPEIAVSAAQGRFLNLLLRSIGAKRVLEIGTLGGYSTIWLARALPEDGQVLTLELNEERAQIATENIANAGLSTKVKVIIGRATDTLTKLEPSPPFDLIFIDADKPSNLDYFIHGKRLVRSGGVIRPQSIYDIIAFADGMYGRFQIVDNVVRYGRVSNMEYTDDNVEGVRRLLRAVKDDKEVDAVIMQTVGEKGYDGFLYAFRK